MTVTIKVHSPLAKFVHFSTCERWINLIGWTLPLLYSVYAVYQASHDFLGDISPYSFSIGWRFLGHRKDVTNYEWDFWTLWFPYVWGWMFTQSALSIILRCAPSAWRPYPYILLSFIALYTLFGWKYLLITLTHVVVIYAVASLGSILLVWIISLLLITTFNLNVTSDYLQSLAEGTDSNYSPLRVFLLFLYSCAMCNLRYTGFAVEWCMYRRAAGHKSDDKKASAPLRLTFTPTDALLYCFYFPLYMYGPVMTYDDFYTQFNSPPKSWSMRDVRNLILESVRIVFWLVVCELVLHHLYFNAIHHDHGIVERLPLWALAGTCYCLGQYFNLKYVVFYSMPGLSARADFLNAPAQPKCISRICKYSEMWKYFDRGLHTFLKRYLYIPMGGSRHGLAWQLVASGACFLFIAHWHGGDTNLLVWVALNYVSITGEALGQKLARSTDFAQFEARWYGARMRRRLHAVCMVPLFMLSTLAIFLFLGGSHLSWQITIRIFYYGLPTSLIITYMALYCGVLTSQEVAEWEAGGPGGCPLSRLPPDANDNLHNGGVKERGKAKVH